jgi:hypothetical protein
VRPVFLSVADSSAILLIALQFCSIYWNSCQLSVVSSFFGIFLMSLQKSHDFMNAFRHGNTVFQAQLLLKVHPIDPAVRHFPVALLQFFQLSRGGTGEAISKDAIFD